MTPTQIIGPYRCGRPSMYDQRGPMAFIAGVIAKFLMAGDNEPSGFILTTKASVVPHFRSNHISYNRADGSASMPLATRKFCRLLRDSPLP